MAAPSSRIVVFSVLLLLAFSASSGLAQVINEFVAEHTGSGTDDHEYLEILGAPSTDYSHLRLLQIAGDPSDDPGRILSIYTPATTNTGGFWATPFLVGELVNQSVSFLLVDGFSGSLDQDLDADDMGGFDLTPWTQLLDSISIAFNGVDDQYYGTPILEPFFDGIQFEVAGASRIPDGLDTDDASDWVRNDWHGEGLPGFDGSLVVGEAENTPGASNFAPSPRRPLLSEVVFEYSGGDDLEYLEIYGESTTDYSGFTILEVEGDDGENPGRIDATFPLAVTDGSGFWQSGPLDNVLENDSKTYLLVESFTGAIGQDLDAGDDGILDAAPWSEIADSLAFDAGAGVTYSATVIDSSFDGVGVLPGGASRYPNGMDSDLASDWYRNDFDGAGLAGSPGAIAAPEAWNTPGSTNFLPSETQYLSVDSTSGANLRATLHEAIDDHVRFPYSSTSTDTWDILELADEDPDLSTSVLTIYKNQSEPKFGGGMGAYNREHSWPKSYGFPDDDGKVYPYTDCFHLFLSIVSYNSARGNLKFDTCHAGCTEMVTDGGTSGDYPGLSNWLDGSGWETWLERRGDIARAQFYMDVRYEGGTHGVTGVTEPQLILTDNASLIQTTSGGTAYMGLLSVLLQWHLEDPVDDRERLRNEIVGSFQGSRNPFIDHPEWVACLFDGGACEAPLFADGFESGDLLGWTSSTP